MLESFERLAEALDEIKREVWRTMRAPLFWLTYIAIASVIVFVQLLMEKCGS